MGNGGAIGRANFDDVAFFEVSFAVRDASREEALAGLLNLTGCSCVNCQVAVCMILYRNPAFVRFDWL